MNTNNFSLHIYHQNGKWIVCRNDKCYNLILLNIFSNRKFLIAFSVISLSTILLAWGPKLPFGKKDAVIAAPAQKIDSIPALTEENLLKEIKNQGIVCENHVLAQAKLESLHLTSLLCTKANNLFGMRYPGRRATTAVGVYLQGENKIIYGTPAQLKKYLHKPTYAVYKSWPDAVKDYKMWQDDAFNVEEKYLSFLNRIYAEAPDYVSVVDKMAKKTQN